MAKILRALARILAADKVAPRNRDECEIAGYRYVLYLIHGQHDAIPVTPGVILQLHRDLYRYEDASFAGRWKDADNVIAERASNGELAVRFKPTGAAETPDAVERILQRLQTQGVIEKVGAARATAYRRVR